MTHRVIDVTEIKWIADQNAKIVRGCMKLLVACVAMMPHVPRTTKGYVAVKNALAELLRLTDEMK